MRVYRVAIRAIGDGGEYYVRVRAASPEEAKVKARAGIDIYEFEFPTSDFGPVIDVSIE
jgi:hypothetical protein